MVLLYDIGIYFYFYLIHVASLFNPKAKSWLNGRKRLFRDLNHYNGSIKEGVWIHCASVGEFEQGRPIIEKIRSDYPELPIILSFFSPSGYNLHKKYPLVDFVTYLPIDTPYRAKKFIRVLNPKMAIFVKYEFWFNTLNELRKNKVPTFIVSARFRDSQMFFKSWGSWFRRGLDVFNHFFVQDTNSKELLAQIGFSNSTVSGDTRFDRVYQIMMTKSEIQFIPEFTKERKTLVAGSTWPKDEEMLIPFINSKPDINFVIAPHEINKKNIWQLEEQLKVNSIRYSEIRKPEDIKNIQVIIIDSVGKLSAIYKYAQFAYVGGGFGHGIHNVLEPAVNGIPIAFGPNYHKFKEAHELIKNGGARSISNEYELKEFYNTLLENSDLYASSCNASSDYVKSNIGSTKKIMSEIGEYLK